MITDEQEKKITELENTMAFLLQGLNASSLDLEWYYFFEDSIINGDWLFSLELLQDHKDHKNLSPLNRSALIFIFKSAIEERKKILS